MKNDIKHIDVISRKPVAGLEAVKTLFTRYGATLYAFISRETQISY